MTVYIAAPYPEQARARALAQLFASHGITPACRWIDSGEQDSDKWARFCLEDVAAADLFVAVNPKEWAETGTGGRHVELGCAIALGKPIVLVGPASNLFHRLATVVRVDEHEDLIPVARRLGEAAAKTDIVSLLKRLVIAFDAEQDEEFSEAIADARGRLGFVLSDDEETACL